MSEFKEVSTTHQDTGKKGRNTSFKVTQVIWLLLGILESTLALRFLFKLIGVNPGNAFASILYGFTNLFVAPFASLTGAPAAEGMVFEFSTLIAMLVYALIFYVLERIVYVIFYRHHGVVSVKQTSVTNRAPDVKTSSHVTQTTTTDQEEEEHTQPTNNLS